MKKLGIITYQANHLKTEQLVMHLLGKYEMRLYALPFVQRPQRSVLYAHRPDQSLGAHPKELCDRFHLEYVPVSRDADMDNECELYLVAGAGILSAECLEGKKVLNAHPGIVPAVRGLDAFKWAIYKGLPVGVTLHYIDARVDEGEILSVYPTPVFPSDTLETFARRHYENEIWLLSNFEDCLASPQNPYADIAREDSTRRMKRDLEAELPEKFEIYKKRYC